MVGHPHRDRAVRSRRGPRPATTAAQQTRVSGPGPERVDEVAGGLGDVGGDAVEGAARPDQHRQRHVAAAALGREQVAYGDPAERVGADAVDGVGGQHDEVAPVDRGHRQVDRLLARLGVGAVEHSAHGWCVLLAGRDVAGRGRPGRRGRPPSRHPPAARTAAGAERPWVSACSTTSRPPGRSSRAAVATDRRAPRRARRRPAVQRGRRVVLAHLGVDRHLVARDVGRVAHHHVDRAVEVVERRRPGRPSRRSTPLAGQVAGRPGVRAPARARRRAPRRAGTSVATASAIAPDPVPRSTTTGRSPGRDQPGRLVDRRPGRRTSVSGPRHEHARADREREAAEPGGAGQVLQRHPARPARPPARRTPTRSASVSGSPAATRASSAPRESPSTWPSSSSASTRGLGTPASASRALASAMAARRVGRVHGRLRPRRAGRPGRRRRRPAPPRRGRRRGPGRGCRP